MISENITAIIDYALQHSLIDKEDCTYCVNRILALIGGNSYEKTTYSPFESIEEILKGLLDFACENGKLLCDTVTYRDILSADIMDVLTPKPSSVNRKFYENYEISPKAATDYFYALSKSNNYIMTERVKKDIRFETVSKYGNLIITVNLSKPEKDPRDIAAAKNGVQSGYPKCLLCAENEGFEGGAAHPPRANHRIIPIRLAGESWYLQYSPYVYYNEHCIVLNESHIPMKINRGSFEKLLSFVQLFPHYFVGSNADLPIVGGSILTHDHFQGGCAKFPMTSAKLRKTVNIKGYEDVKTELLDWALSTIRLKSENVQRLAELGDKILTSWRAYSDEENEILAETDAPHNTITPIARKNCGKYELDLILRNNRCTEEHPLGIFHPHAEYHHIKKENIGLIEAMGLAVLPPRLVKEYDLNDKSVRAEIGSVFEKILENCAVFKRDEKGFAGFDRFMAQL